MATGFAVGATYLNLERFRYREKIRSRATSLHDELSKKQGYKKYKNFDTVKLIKYLSGLLDHDPMGNDHKNKKATPEKAPDNAGFACWCYNTFYSKHFDRKAILVTSALSFIGLILGVAHAAEITTFMKPATESTVLDSIILILSVVACLLPLVFIKGGNSIVRRLGDNAQKAYDQIAEVLKEEISEKATLNN